PRAPTSPKSKPENLALPRRPPGSRSAAPAASPSAAPPLDEICPADLSTCRTHRASAEGGGRPVGCLLMSTRRVLVVEDERTIADAVAARLRAEGFEVAIAGNGPDAVARAAVWRPDLVVLDIMLPGFDGL